ERDLGHQPFDLDADDAPAQAIACTDLERGARPRRPSSEQRLELILAKEPLPADADRRQLALAREALDATNVEMEECGSLFGTESAHGPTGRGTRRERERGRSVTRAPATGKRTTAHSLDRHGFVAEEPAHRAFVRDGEQQSEARAPQLGASELRSPRAERERRLHPCGS